MFGTVGSVAVAISLRYGVGFLGVRHGEHSLSALPQSPSNTSISSLEGSLFHYGSDGDQVHCRKRKLKGRLETFKEREKWIKSWERREKIKKSR